MNDIIISRAPHNARQTDRQTDRHIDWLCVIHEVLNTQYRQCRGELLQSDLAANEGHNRAGVAGASGVLV